MFCKENIGVILHVRCLYQIPKGIAYPAQAFYAVEAILSVG